MTDRHDRHGRAPLGGVKVIDLSRYLSGPYATLMLADAGADVVKVERPRTGDDTRGWGPPFIEGRDGRESAYFLSVNRSKRSVALDLTLETDRDQLRRLIVNADVLVENFRPGFMASIGLDPEELERINPRLVTLAISGFGEGGPDGGRRGFDQIIQGEAGLMSLTGPPDRPPSKFGVPITDILAGMFGAFGVMAALRERDVSGRGQRVTTSLLAAAVAVHTFQGTRWTIGGEVPRRQGNRHPTIAPYGAFSCADGWINLAVGSESLWKRFAAAVGLDPDDSRYQSNGERVRRADELEAEVNGAMLANDVAHWLLVMEELGIPAGRIRGIDEVYQWDQVGHLGLGLSLSHPGVGSIIVPGPPIGYSRSGPPTSAPPPRLDEHRDDVLGSPGQ